MVPSRPAEVAAWTHSRRRLDQRRVPQRRLCLSDSAVRHDAGFCALAVFRVAVDRTSLVPAGRRGGRCQGARTAALSLSHNVRPSQCMTLPSLSIVTPSYNSAEFLEDALRSVARQQGIAAEHIVIDGASTDDTVAILQRHPSVQWLSERDRGQSDAINKGFLRATGDLVGWLNADDYYLPGGLEAIARAAHE